MAGVRRPLRSDIPLVFQGPPPGISPKGLHEEYVSWVRPGASERVFKTPWTADRGLGTRRFDDYNKLTRTGFEGNTTPWSQMTQEQLSRKLDQVGSDLALLKTNPKVQRIVCVLPARMHESGGRPSYGHEQEDGSWHDRDWMRRHAA